jgi:hypothetical protein
VIITRSLCVGFDCVNGEVFGADTIRLKENNLRIKFEDTSVGAFPSSDWQLTANDSASGGANKFSIDDISGGRTPFTVEANSPSHSLYVDNGGRIGFGTSIPVVELHVKDGDTPTLRLEQDTSSGFGAQTWDVAGNETSFFVRDATNGSTLPFRIRPGAPSASVFVDVDGDVGLSDSSPDASLDIERTSGDASLALNATNGSAIANLSGNGGATQMVISETNGTVTNRVLLDLQNNGPANFNMTNSSSGTVWQVRAGNTNFILNETTDVADLEFDLQGDGDLTIGGMLTENSDRNAKENFEPVNPQDVLERVLGLEISTWNYKTDDPSERHMGVMAQDFYEAFGLGEYENKIGMLDVGGVAITAIQGLHQRLLTKEAELEEKDETIRTLLQQNQEFGDRLERLENLMNTNRNSEK